jgi:hypothetical protein
MTPFLSCQGEAGAADREQPSAKAENGQLEAGSLKEKEPWQPKANHGSQTNQD